MYEKNRVAGITLCNSMVSSMFHPTDAIQTQETLIGAIISRRAWSMVYTWRVFEPSNRMPTRSIVVNSFNWSCSRSAIISAIDARKLMSIERPMYRIFIPRICCALCDNRYVIGSSARQNWRKATRMLEYFGRSISNIFGIFIRAPNFKHRKISTEFSHTREGPLNVRPVENWDTFV